MLMRNPSLVALKRAFARIPNAVLFAIELLTLLVVLAFAWKARSVWPAVPIADPDTWGYLSPALSWLSGLGLRQNVGRDWLYPAMLALFLKTSGSFAGIAVWQKLLGVLSGILMALTWRCWVSLLPLGRWVRFCISLAGALPIFVQLINPQTALFEVSIRPEAVLSFFVYAQLACLVGYCKYRWLTPRALPSVCLGSAAIVLAYACLVLKPSWYLACATTSLPVFAGLFGHALSLKVRFLTPALGIVISLLLLWLPAKTWMIHDAASRTLLPDALFCVHAPLIAKRLEAKLSALPDSDPEKARLQALVTVLENEIRTAANDPHAYEYLGINADYLMHSNRLLAAIHDYAGNDREKFRAFCLGSYQDAVTHYPSDYTKKVFVQFTHFLFPDPKSLFGDNMDLARLYRESPESLPPYKTAGLRSDWQEIYRRYQGDMAAQIGIHQDAGQKPKGSALWGKTCARWAVPVEILFFPVLVATLIWPPLPKAAPRRDGRLSSSSWPPSATRSGCASSTLSISIDIASPWEAICSSH